MKQIAKIAFQSGNRLKKSCFYSHARKQCRIRTCNESYLNTGYFYRNNWLETAGKNGAELSGVTTTVVGEA
jgi:hypothetical protein